jgi:hypothetical protein
LHGHVASTTTFTALIEPRPRGGVAIKLPFDPAAEWGGRDRYDVTGAIDGRNVGEWASGVDAFAQALTALRGERSVRVGRHIFAPTSGTTCRTSVVPTWCVMRASSTRVRAAVCHGPRMMP